MERERSSSINTLIVSTEGIRGNRPYGVTNVILQSRDSLQGREILGKEMNIRLVGPRIPVQENNLANVTLGRRARLPINKTKSEASMIWLSGKRKAKKFLREEDPDLVIIHQPIAGNVTHSLITADQKKEICFVGYFHAQTETLDTASKLFYFSSHFLRKPRVKKSPYFLGLTPGFKETINERFDGRVAVSKAAGEFWDKFLPGDYEIIYNGIDTSWYKPGEKRDKWKQNGERIIFAAARFDERKGLDILLLAIGILVFDYNMRDVRAKIAGDGAMKKELLALRAKLRLEDYVEFLGFESPEDLVRDYATADCFTSPVLGGEAFGLTLGEAMACETLVVGSNVRGYNEVIGGNLPFAWMTKPGDIRDLADKLKIVLDMDPDERKNRGRLARKYVEKNFSLTRNIDHQASYYESCLIARSKK